MRKWIDGWVGGGRGVVVTVRLLLLEDEMWSGAAIWTRIFARGFLHVLGMHTRGASAAAGSGTFFPAC